MARKIVAVLGIASALACSSKSNPGTAPCNENPWECTAGQTCWPTSAAAFACLNSGPGVAGGACKDSVGIATCGDGLACLETSASNGTCTPYCDNANASHACPSGLTCQLVQVLASGEAQFQVCVGGDVGSDAGPGGDSSSSGADSGTTAPPATGAADGGAIDSGISIDSGIAVESGVVI
jgi:hypothetical protein